MAGKRQQDRGEGPPAHASPDLLLAVPRDGGESMSDQESGPGFTGRYVAGLRYMESSRVAQPLLVDPLAGKLAGAKGLELAQRELENLERDQVRRCEASTHTRADA